MRRSMTKNRRPELFLFVLACAFCAWILYLPVFPSQDGPMHLYIARIMQALIFHHQPGIFPQYFYVKALVPPYALYYYLLIGLANIFSFPIADKIVVCLYIFLLLFGFRYLATSISLKGS